MIPTSIGRYQVQREIARGGMSVVYHAFDPRFERDVAVKVLHAAFVGDDAFRTRFRREALTVAALEHPAIVPVYDFGDTADQPYLVMRFMRGGTLQQRLESEGFLNLTDAAVILQRLAWALDLAHENGVVHRDLKPGNVLFDAAGIAYLSDFGIAHLSNAGLSLTGSSVIGTPSFMSPEQVYGDRPVDQRSDIYGLGCLLFLMLTGRPPFEGDLPAKIMMQHLMAPVPNIGAWGDFPAGLNDIIEQVLAKEPDERFPTAGAVAAALTLLADTRPNARPADAPDAGAGNAGPPKPPAAAAESGAAAAAIQQPEAQAVPPEAVTREHARPQLPPADTATSPSLFEPPPAAMLLPQRADRSALLWGALGLALLALVAVGGWLLLGNRSDATTLPGSGLTGELAVPTLPATLPPNFPPPTIVVATAPGAPTPAALTALPAVIAATNADRVTEWRRLGRGTIEEIALSPDGSLLAVSGGLGIWLYDPLTLDPLALLSGHERSTRTVAWSPLGERLASGSDDGTIRFWNVATAETERVLSGHTDWVRSVDWNPDGDELASAGSDGSVRLWRGDDGALVRTVDTFDQSVRMVAYAPSGALLAAAVGTEVWLYDLFDGGESVQLSGHETDITDVKWSPDGNQVAAGATDGTITIWDVAQGDVVQRFDAHNGRILALAFAPGGRLLASGGGDNLIRIWDSTNGAEIAVLTGHQSTIRSLIWPSDDELLSGAIDGTLRRWDVRSRLQITISSGHLTSVNAVAFAPNDQMLALGISDNTARIWNLATNSEEATLAGHSSWVSSLAWSPAGSWLCTADFNGQIRLWPAGGGDPVSLGSQRTIVSSVDWSSDDQLIASGGRDGIVRLWKPTGGGEPQLLVESGSVESVAFAPAARQLAVGTAQGTIAIWNLETVAVERVLNGHSDAVGGLAWSPDGTRLVSAGNDRTLRIWDVETGNELRQLVGHSGWVTTVGWSPSGEIIASGGFDGTVRLWDARTGSPLRVLEGHRYAVWSIDFAPDGRLLASAGGDGSARIWATEE